MVSVYSTTLPSLSATVRLVVLTPSVSGATSPLLVGVAQLPSDAATLPAATGGVNASSGSILHARSAAYVSESRVLTGTPLWSPTYLARSANARCAASITRCCTCAGVIDFRS